MEILETHLRVEGKASLEKEEFKMQNLGNYVKGTFPKSSRRERDRYT